MIGLGSSKSQKPKGKQATKGSKQIQDENEATLKFYRNMIIISNAIYFSYLLIIGADISYYNYIASILTALLSISSYCFMRFMTGGSSFSSGGQVHCGTDINADGSISEHMKDIIILSSIVQLLSLVWSYFWFVLLLIPCRASWILWTNVLNPILSSTNNVESNDMSDKKKKKMERRVKRAMNG